MNRHARKHKHGKMLGIVASAALLVSGGIAGGHLYANAADENNPYASAVVTKTYDGTGFDTDSASFVNAKNGYFPGDNGPNDGVVSSNDLVGYEVVTQINAAPARSIDVSFQVPEYLTYDPALNRGLCASNQFVTGKFTGTNVAPKCTYTAQKGTPVRLTNDLTLTANDTAGLVQADQVVSVSTSVSGGQPFVTTSADPVTVVSAPAADLVIRPQGCSTSGSCSAVDSSTSSLSFFIEAETLSYPGYARDKGQTKMSPWTATFVGPTGEDSLAPYTITGTAPDGSSYSQTCDNDSCEIGPIVGNATVKAADQTKWAFAEETPEGTTRDFAAHVLVPDTAFAVGSYQNNGDGWEPGQDQGPEHNTYDDRGTGARRGYRLANNDYTILQIYKVEEEEPEPEDGSFRFSKFLERPWDSTQTLWEPGNTSFSAGEARRASHSGNYDKVTEGTEVRPNLQVFSQDGTDEVTADNPVVLADVWDPAEFVPTSAVTVTPPAGATSDSYSYYVQWSQSPSQSDSPADPNSDQGWVTSTTPIPDAAALRVVFTKLPVGRSNPEAGIFAASFDGRITDDFESLLQPNGTLKNIYDALSGWGNGEATATRSQAFVVPKTESVPRPYLSITSDPANNSTIGVMDGDLQVKYSYQPSVGDVVSSTSTLRGQVTIELDPCISVINLVDNDYWTATDVEVGSCSAGTPGHITIDLNDGWQASGLNDGRITPPGFALQASFSRLASGSVTTGATWTVTEVGDQSLEGISVAQANTIHNVAPIGTIAPKLTTSTPVADRDSDLNWQVVISGANKDNDSASHPTQTVVVLPGSGNDTAYLAQMQGEGAGGYEGAEASDYRGNYTVQVQVVDADSVPGTTVECTTENNPSLDPTVGTWGTCGSNPTAVRITQPGGANTGVSTVNLTLHPQGNDQGDIYLMWMGPVVPTDGSESSKMPFPVEDEIVSFQVAGYVYWDATGRGLDHLADSEPLAGITVQLLDGPGDAETPKVLDTTSTDEDGHYAFDELYSGTYYVQLLDQANGQTGHVPASVESVYDPAKQVPVEATYSYQGRTYPYASLQSTAVKAGVNLSTSNVNFGFWAGDAYGDLLKVPSKIDCEDDDSVTCNVSWDVVIKNGGGSATKDTVADTDVTLTGGKLTDSTSKEVYDVEAIIGEKIVGITGEDPRYSGLGVATTQGYWLLDYNGGLSEITGFTGTPLFVSGDAPYSSVGGSVLATTDGFWLVGIDLFTGNQVIAGIDGTAGTPLASAGASPSAPGSGSLLATSEGYWVANGTTAKQVTGDPITGQLIDMVATKPSSSSAGAGIATSEGYWVVTNGVATKAQGISGVPLMITGDDPAMRWSGSAVLTDQGLWFIDEKAQVQAHVSLGSGQQVTGNPVALIGTTPLGEAEVGKSNAGGVGVATTDGYWIMWFDAAQKLTVLKIDDIEGQPLFVAGDFPAWSKDNCAGSLKSPGSVVVTDQGVYGVRFGSTGVTPNCQTHQLEVEELFKTSELNGSPLGVLGAENPAPDGTAAQGFAVITTQGATVFNGGNRALRQVSVPGVPTLWRGNGIPSKNGFALATAEGVWTVIGRSGTATTYDATKVGDIGSNRVILPPTSEAISGLDDGFVQRDYRIPTLEPGDEITVTLSGKVNRKSAATEPKSEGLVVGNQAWFAADQLPLDPVPTLDKKTLPAYNATSGEEYVFGQWSGNDTCTATDDWELPGDQCGQVFAQIPPTQAPLGALTGSAWWDKNHNGKWDDGEPGLVGIHVLLFQIKEGVVTPMGETWTDSSGDYQFDDLEPIVPADEDNGYYVVFQPGPDPKYVEGGEQVGIITAANESWAYTEQYDTPRWPYSFVDAKGQTPPWFVLGGEDMPATAGMSAGLVTYTNGLSVQKGYCEPASAGDNGACSVDLEQNYGPGNSSGGPAYNESVPVSVKVSNDGTDPVSQLVFTDMTTTGTKNVDWQSCAFPDETGSGGNTVPLTGTWNEGVYTHTFDTSLTLGAGESFTCSGTLAPLGLKGTHRNDLLVQGVSVNTGNEVGDESDFTVVTDDLKNPVPGLSIQKGILLSDVAETQCVGEDQEWADGSCWMKDASGLGSATITFRVTNTGDEDLWDPSVVDEVVLGDVQAMSSLNCPFSEATNPVTGKMAKVLYASQNSGENQLSTVDCTASLELEPGSDHKDIAYAFGVGAITGELTRSDSSEFEARSNVTAPVLPPLGGTSGTLVGLVGLLMIGGTAYMLRRVQQTKK